MVVYITWITLVVGYLDNNIIVLAKYQHVAQLQITMKTHRLTQRSQAICDVQHDIDDELLLRQYFIQNVLR